MTKNMNVMEIAKEMWAKWDEIDSMSANSVDDVANIADATDARNYLILTERRIL